MSWAGVSPHAHLALLVTSDCCEILSSVKPLRNAKHLRAMAQARVIALPEVQRRIAIDRRLAPTVGDVVPHQCDASGRNWTILDIDRGEGIERQFRDIVAFLRDTYDLG